MSHVTVMLAAAESTVMKFIEGTIRKAFNVNSSMAVRLLANNSRELITTATIGLNGKNFTPILAWYQSLFPQVSLMC